MGINVVSPFISFPVLYVLIMLFFPLSLKTNLLILLFFINFYFFGLIGVGFSIDKMFIRKKGNQVLFTISKKLRVCASFIVLAYSLSILILYFKYGYMNEYNFRFFISNKLSGAFVLIANIASILVIQSNLSELIIKGKIINKIKFFSWLAMLLIVALLSGSRFQMLSIIIPLFVVVYQQCNISNRQLLFGGIFLLIAALALRIYTVYRDVNALDWAIDSGVIDSKSIFKTIKYFGIHTLRDIAYRTDVIINNVPKSYDHTRGRSLFFHFLSILPGKQSNPTIELNHILFHGSDRDVGYPPTLVAQLYLDFSYIGIIIGGAYFGFTTGIVMALQKKNGAINIIYVLLVFYLLVACYGEFLLFHWVVYSIAVMLIPAIIHKNLHSNNSKM